MLTSYDRRDETEEEEEERAPVSLWLSGTLGPLPPLSQLRVVQCRCGSASLRMNDEWKWLW